MPRNLELSYRTGYLLEELLPAYGFVTFETEEEARRIQREADVILKDRKLNIAPAIKKQPFARVYEPTPVVPNGTILYPSGIPLTYPNGVTFFSAPESVCTYGNPQANFNVIYPSSVYLPQQSIQCHPTGTPYPPTTAVPEMAQLIPAPAPPHFFIPEHNY
ncbi:protein boule-like isoform X2 [Stegodyphus dumicola]|uniref:protein boule-like isoform X2 n=1 Tax=Stegodyphus dumicola TaxID=202533 RepID=UPI0015ABF990|nr:protein boule-like isoform X2 [Stegodyphus dumicola]